jgi:hypothetical protein
MGSLMVFRMALTSGSLKTKKLVSNPEMGYDSVL